MDGNISLEAHLKIVRAAVLAERQRCADIAEAKANRHALYAATNTGPQRVRDIAMSIAAW